MPSIITAGDATNGASLTAGSNGSLIIRSGLAGAKVNAAVAAADGTLTFLRAPIYSGSILQVVTGTDAGLTFSNTSRTSVFNTQVSITPRSTSSRLIIQIGATVNLPIVSGTNIGAIFDLSEGATLIAGSYTYEVASGTGGIRLITQQNYLHSAVNSALTTRAFGLFGRVFGAGASCTISNIVVIITEVQN